jgi:hypothetical protein
LEEAEAALKDISVEEYVGTDDLETTYTYPFSSAFPNYQPKRSPATTLFSLARPLSTPTSYTKPFTQLQMPSTTIGYSNIRTAI